MYYQDWTERPYDTLTGFNVVSLRHTGAATLIVSRTLLEGREGRERERIEYIV